jgi:hypothetical protein
MGPAGVLRALARQHLRRHFSGAHRGAPAHPLAVGELCVVADRGMISQPTLGELEARGWRYILGTRMRRHKEVRGEVQRDKALIGIRKYLASLGERFVIDEEAVRREARYHGKWVLRTNNRAQRRRGGTEVQAVVEGRGAVSYHQVAARHPAHLPPLR